ncbi:hypothetical protein HDU96_004801 [Phlyctochytrium bullatum]|nr:hypothetical protein HDU96_004801 [Phlyctochytrium bullatum]
MLFPRTSRVQLPIPEVNELPSSSEGKRGLIGNSQNVSDRVALVSACLNTGDVDRAEVIFHRTIRALSAEEKKAFVSIGMINSFLEALLEPRKPLKPSRKSPFERAKGWLETLKGFEIAANAVTYAICVRYCLRKNEISEATNFIQQMERSGISPAKLLRNHRFLESDDRTPLLSLLKATDKHDESSSPAVESLQDSLLNPDSIKGSSDALMLTAMREDAIGDESGPLRVIDEISQTDTIGVGILRDMLKRVQSKQYKSLLEKQEQIEEQAMVAALEEEEKQADRLPSDLRSIMNLPSRLLVEWNRLLVPAISREMDSIRKATRDADQHTYLPLLELLPPEQLAKITITVFVRFIRKNRHDDESLSATKMTTTSLLLAIGNTIEQEYGLQQLKRQKNNKALQNALQMHKIHLNGALFDSSVRLLASLLMKVAKVQVPYPDPENPKKDM